MLKFTMLRDNEQLNLQFMVHRMRVWSISGGMAYDIPLAFEHVYFQRFMYT
jgi:hypothetical protein